MRRLKAMPLPENPCVKKKREISHMEKGGGCTPASALKKETHASAPEQSKPLCWLMHEILCFSISLPKLCMSCFAHFGRRIICI
jgi:hypothetical protein